MKTIRPLAPVRLRPYAEAGHGLGDALIVPGHPVPLTEFGSGPSPLILIHRSRYNLFVLVEVALKAARREDLQDPNWLGNGVAQGVGHFPRLEDVRADRGDRDLATDVARQLALQDKVALVLTAVGVRGYHLTGRKAPLFDRERTAEVLRSDLVDTQGGTSYS